MDQLRKVLNFAKAWVVKKGEINYLHSGTAAESKAEDNNGKERIF